jgi:DNA replication protein DnaC
MTTAELLIVDDLFLCKFHHAAGDELSDVIVARYEKSLDDHHLETVPWTTGRDSLGMAVVVTRILDRLMHHGPLLKLEGKRWRLKEAAARVAKQGAAK